MTKFKSFSYTKKKDSEVKNYLIMELDDTENHVGGLDLSKLTEEEIIRAFDIKLELGTLENSIEGYEELEKYKTLQQEFKQFIKKSYRKYIKENMKDVIYQQEEDEDNTDNKE